MADVPQVPLPDQSPRCRYCGGPMFPGFLQRESVRTMTPATVNWIDSGSGLEASLGDVGGFGWSKSPRFPGFQCEKCGAIDLKPLPAETDDDFEPDRRRRERNEAGPAPQD